jgi:hypothetical protein
MRSALRSLSASHIAREKPMYRRKKAGGANRDRTDDLLLAKQALSQLSYGPIKNLVGLGRVELPTSPLSGVRSNQLSYRPGVRLGRLMQVI